MERATVPRGSGGGAEVVVSLLSSIPELFCSQNPLGSSENVTGWDGFLGREISKIYWEPRVLIKRLDNGHKGKDFEISLTPIVSVSD